MNLIITKKKKDGRIRHTVQVGLARAELIAVNKSIDRHLTEGSPLGLVITSTFINPKTPGSCCLILEEEKL